MDKGDTSNSPALTAIKSVMQCKTPWAIMSEEKLHPNSVHTNAQLYNLKLAYTLVHIHPYIHTTYAHIHTHIRANTNII